MPGSSLRIGTDFHVTTLDIIVLLLMAGNAAIGFRRGFVHEIMTLAALIVAICAVYFLHTPVAALVAPYVGTTAGSATLAFALVFGIVFAIGKFAAHRVGAASRGSFIGPFDRALGVGFGLIKGLTIATAGFLLFSLVYDTMLGRAADRPEWVAEGRTYPLLSASGAAISGFVDRARKRGDDHAVAPR